MEHSLSVLLIAHDEEACIGKVVEGMLASYAKEILEIVVVDDASRDGTAAVVEACGRQNNKVRLVKRTSPCGVGRALKTGFENIDPRAQYILSMDSDFVENIGQVRSLIKAMDQADGDGVIGSRFMDGSRLVNYPFLKRIMNRFFHIVVKALFSVRQNDLSNNFKLYKASVFKTLPWRSSDFAMNAETGLLPVLAGYRITEVPVWWVGRRPQMGRSKFSLFKNGASYARVIGTAWQFARARRRSSGRGVLP